MTERRNHMSEEGFPRIAADPGSFFNAAPAIAPARPFFAASDDANADVPDALLRAGRAADVELTSPPDATEPDGADGIEFYDSDDPDADYFELAQQQGLEPEGQEAPGISPDGQQLTDAAGNTLERDVRNDPQYQALQRQLADVQNARQTEKSKEVAAKLRQQMEGIKQRRFAIFREADEGKLDQQTLMQRISQEWTQSDQELNYWRGMTMQALGYVNRMQLMAQAVQGYNLSDEDATRLADVPDHQIMEGAAWLANERDKANMTDPRVAQLEAQVAQLTEQVNARTGRRRPNRAAFAAGGGSTAPGNRPQQRIKKGSDAHLAFQLFDPRGGFDRQD